LGKWNEADEWNDAKYLSCRGADTGEGTYLPQKIFAPSPIIWRSYSDAKGMLEN